MEEGNQKENDKNVALTHQDEPAQAVTDEAEHSCLR
jgi:hypothetical protein